MAALRVFAGKFAAVVALCAVCASASGGRGNQSGELCQYPYDVDATAVGLGCLFISSNIGNERSDWSWELAKHLCELYDSQLVEWNTTEQYDFLNAILLDSGEYTRSTSYWVGGTDDGHEGVWRWAASSRLLPPDFPWGVNRPDGSYGSDCLALRQGINDDPTFKGDDAPCRDHREYICQLLPEVA